jgi:hypothetical protein
MRLQFKTREKNLDADESGFFAGGRSGREIRFVKMARSQFARGLMQTV